MEETPKKAKGRGKKAANPTQCVVLKGQRDGITVMLDPKVSFDEIKTVLRSKVAGAKRFFEGANATVTFKGRTLTEEAEQELLDIIMTETTLDVAFVESEGFTLLPPKPQPPPPDPDAPAALSANFNNYKPDMEGDTAFFSVNLRSGQQIRYKGSVVIVGDVNPTSQIIADGNVIVLGALKGLVHAGAIGDDTCYITALEFRPTQLRIANTITYIPPEEVANAKDNGPARAYIKNGQVFVEQL